MNDDKEKPLPEPEWPLQDGILDFKGRPALKSRTGGCKSVILILGTELCERLATLGIGLNLITYLVNEMHLSASQAPNIVTNFLGTSYVCCLIGGLAADSFLGRYRTIVYFSLLQLMGMTLLTLSASLPSLRPSKCYSQNYKACDPAQGVQLATLYLALYLTALGTGGIKSCVSAFGADQFDENDSQERLSMPHFFNWFVVAISVGALLAVTVLIYIQDNVGRSWGYGVSAGSMLVAILAFCAGTPLYRYKPSNRNSSVSILRVLVAAVRKRKLQVPADPALLYEQPSLPQEAHLSHTDGFRFLDKAAVLDPSRDADGKARWKLCGVTEVEQVKMLIRILPICATSVLVYTVFAQMTTLAIEQGATMQRSLWRNFKFPPGSLGIFIQISLIFSTAFYDQVLIPVVRMARRSHRGITTLQRIGFGMVFSTMAMVTAALVEKRRLETAKKYHLLDRPKETVPMSIFWLVPQYSLVGMSEVFTYVGQLEFFYSQSPEQMRSMGTGLFMSTISVGFFVSSCLVSLIGKLTGNKWISENINRGRIDKFYWLLAVLSLFNLGMHVLCAHWYKYRDPRSTNLQQQQQQQHQHQQQQEHSSSGDAC